MAIGDVGSGCVGHCLLRRRLAVGTWLTLVVGVAAAGASPPPEGSARSAVQVSPAAGPTVLGFTAPSRKSTLTVTTTGRIAQFLTDEGRAVRANEVVAQLDDSVQRSRTEFSRLRSESELEIKLARVKHGRTLEDLRRLEELPSELRASAYDLSQLQSAAEAARLEVLVAERDHALAIHDYQTQKKLLDEMQVRAPFDGYVAERLAEAGETMEPDRGVLVVVQLDPLQVAFDCPIALVPDLSAGDRLTVRPLDVRWPPRVGVIRNVNRVADAGSQTVKVKLDVPNADSVWIAGMKVQVELAAREIRPGAVSAERSPPPRTLVHGTEEAPAGAAKE